MKYIPTEARCVFVDGPVAIFVHEAPEQTILDAYANLKGVIEVAAKQLDTSLKEVEKLLYRCPDCQYCNLSSTPQYNGTFLVCKMCNNTFKVSDASRR